MKKVFILLLLLCVVTNYIFAEETKLLRYPNASENEITFTYAGDIYTVPIEGGLARRITNSNGLEIFPRFSPDGKWIAFSGEYDGNREVYIIPSKGGEPKRLTYQMDIPGLPGRMGPDKIIMQWTNDGKSVIYRGRYKEWNAWCGKLLKIDINGGLPYEYPLPRVGFTSFSTDGKKIAYNRVFREFRTWKRYRGGQADDIWIYDFETKELKNITNHPAQDIIPMWYKDKIYFLSDRDHFMNLFVYDLNTEQIKKVTNFDKYDVKFPSLGSKFIAFENGGNIYLLDPETDKYNKVTIEVNEDFEWNRIKLTNVKDKILSWEISHDGNRALFVARGEIFTVPAEKGKIYNLTNTPEINEKNAVWSPDGKWIAFIKDDGKENEIYLMSPDGKQQKKLTTNSKSYIWEMQWSPDSKKLAFSDKLMKLYYIDIETGKIIEVVKSKQWEIRNYSWSPDSKWIAYTDFINNFVPQIYLYSIDKNEIYDVSDEFFQSQNPVFSKDGKYLFFESYREFSPRVGNFEWNFQYDNETKLFGICLQDTLQSPFAFEEDTVQIKREDVSEKSSKKKKNDKTDEDTLIKIDLKGIKDRIFEIPVPKGNYGKIVSTQKGLYYSRNGKFYKFDFDKKEEKKVGDFSSFEISYDENKILFNSKDKYIITKLDDNINDKDGELDLTDMVMTIDRKQEWAEIFYESWRQMRDFFYDPNMHGVDWESIKNKYAELLPYVQHRYDLSYIIGEMIGELNCGHSYVGGGEKPKVEKVKIGLLGAEFEFDENANAYKITKILKGRNWDENTRSPLAEPGLDVKEGYYLFEIDGIRLTKEVTPFKALNGKANKYVNLKVGERSNYNLAHQVTVNTIDREDKLRYYNWVEENRQKVEKATNGRVGYIHIPDMSMDGLNEFVKYFYPQLKKEALIIDDRYNGGGNVSPMIIERLRRILLVAKHARNQEVVGTNPDAVMTGPMVCLLNEISASDGDLFPYQFNKAGLGPLIGKRSWGGVIGIRGSLPFLDGGYLYKPEFANFGADGKWVLEGIGMQPDIEVDNHPDKEYSGIDEQLNKAIEVVLELIKTNTKPQVPQVPPFPDKSK